MQFQETQTIFAQVLVEEGAEVEAGAPLLVMEAMKMEHTVKAPCCGVVGSMSVAVGDQVTDGRVLAVIKPQAATSPVADERVSVQPVLQV